MPTVSLFGDENEEKRQQAPRSVQLN